ncbi:MAG TPA: hypothetical protein VHY35_08935 [Stellaceae bacterium]|nr:hypothetical protein [Stellaceae bacterium]
MIFRAVLPAASEETWDDLRFAYLQRLFRGQVRSRGALEQWNITHSQMRATIRAWLPNRRVAESDLHRAMAKHLLTLPIDDPLRSTETMLHLLGAQLTQATIYYSDPDLPDVAVAGATRVLASASLADQQTTLARVQVAAMLALPDLSSVVIGQLADRLLSALHDAVAAAGLQRPVHDLLVMLHPRERLRCPAAGN